MTYEQRGGIPLGNTDPGNAEREATLLAEAGEIFEIDAVFSGGRLHSAPAVAAEYVYVELRESIKECPTCPDDKEPDRNEVIITALKAVRGGIAYLQDQGCDLLTDRNALVNNVPLMVRLNKSYDELSDLISKNDDAKDLNVEEVDAQFVAMNLASLFSAGRRGSRFVLNKYEQELQSSTPMGNLMRIIAQNPSAARYENQRLLRRLMHSDFDDLLASTPERSAEHHEPPEDEVPGALDVLSEAVKEQSLDFSVLPPGTSLYQHAVDIVEQTTQSEKASVDLGRLKILDDVRELVGPERCYYARGKRTGKTVATETGDRVDEDYIILVMQNHDENGEVTSEDALAISPIARRHAAFVVRHDVSEGLSWREIFQLTKRDARDLGARRVKFTAAGGRAVDEAVEEKLFTLLTCEPEQFNDEFKAEKDGRYSMYCRGVGVTALTATESILSAGKRPLA